ncbi:MAG: DNA alkylation repair protein [Bdellovibrionales bacterium]|nr:DNA alkylation repair protein [Bdellovibrionales bacterium]
MKKYAKELAEVERAIRALPRAKRPEMWMAKNYVGAGESKFEFLDLTVPTLDARLRKGFSFTALPVSEQWPIWDFVFRNSPTFEVVTAAFAFADRFKAVDLAPHGHRLVAWVERSDNWATSDGLSSFYARLLEHDRAQWLPLLAKWAESPNPWKRRQSLVSLLYYSRGRDPKRILPFAKLRAFIERHLDDPHYYVQKGVGWAIRETYNVYPRETVAWLRKRIGRIAAPAWQAATEKLPPATKVELKASRKVELKERRKTELKTIRKVSSKHTKSAARRTSR